MPARAQVRGSDMDAVIQGRALTLEIYLRAGLGALFRAPLSARPSVHVSSSC